MRILILSTIGPNYQSYFKMLGSEFKKMGHTVIFASDSTIGNLDYGELNSLELEDTYYFSKFENCQKTTSLPEDINLWRFFIPDIDRYHNYGFHTNKNSCWYFKLANNLWSFFESIFIKENIDLVVYENISNSFSYFAYECARRKGITYIGAISSRLPGRMEFVTGVDSSSKRIKSRFLELVSSNTNFKLDESDEDYLINYFKRLNEGENIKPDYMVYDSLEIHNPKNIYIKKEKLKLFIRRFLHRRDVFAIPYYMGVPVIFSMKIALRNFKRYLRAKEVSLLFQKPLSEQKYFLFPLQFHPESSTSVLAPFYMDDLEILKKVAMNLPIGYILYVKDHISSFAYQDLKFYQEIRKIPNVRLLSYSENTIELIQNSKGVVTISSTVGYEALLLGKPVWVFSDVFYDFHPNCNKILDYNMLFDSFCSIQNFSNKVDNLIFLKAYFLETYSGTLQMSELKELDFENLCTNIILFYKKII